MENRNIQGRTLLPHQRKIWTEAFKASMHHTSIESAERKAWQAVDICERVGVFGEVSRTTNQTLDYVGAWQMLIDHFSGIGERSIAESLFRFADGIISVNDLRNQLNTVEVPDHVIDWEAAWSYLGTALWECSKSPNDWEDRVASAMRDYAKSEMKLAEFKQEVDLLFRDPSE